MITQGDVIEILRGAVYTVVISSAPLLLVAIIVGLLVSIFQATTQINEQTLAFVPKIVAVMLALLFFGAFIFETVDGFVLRLFETLSEILR